MCLFIEKSSRMDVKYSYRKSSSEELPMLNLSPIKFLFSNITTESKKYLGLTCSFDINAGCKKTISNKKYLNE